MIEGRMTLEMKEINERISKEKIVKCMKRQKNIIVVISRLTELFNQVWEYRVTLIHKGRYNSKNEVKNYRRITLVKTESKVFIAVLNEKKRKRRQGRGGGGIGIYRKIMYFL